MTTDDDGLHADGSESGSTDRATPNQGEVPLHAEPRDTQGRALMAFVGLAVVVFVIGLAVWIAGGGADDDVPSASVNPAPTSVTPTTSAPTPTSPPATAATPATTAPPATTTPPTTSPPTTAAPAFSLPAADAETWTVPSAFEPIAPEMTLRLAAAEGDVRVFDGVTEEVRCVGVVGPGDAVTTWCGPTDAASSFIADRGGEPVVVELGADTGDATITVQASGWTLASNGCSDPVATILGGIDPGALAVTDIICRGDEVFLGVGSSLFGPGVAPDGGGILAVNGDEGWDVIDFGTSIGCAGSADGVDRCALFGVSSELSEALLPIPSSIALGATSVDVAGVTDRSADVRGWIDGATDADEIETIVVEQLVDPASEVAADVRRSDGLQLGRKHLLIVEIPQLDDSIRTETWAVWIGALGGDAPITAFSWATCARGVTGDGLCI